MVEIVIFEEIVRHFLMTRGLIAISRSSLYTTRRKARDETRSSFVTRWGDCDVKGAVSIIKQKLIIQ